jgi:hypothetical protein
MNKFVIYVVLLFFISCTTKEKETSNLKPYKVSYAQLQVDTTIRDIVYSSGYFLCLQENLKIAAFDSTFTRNKIVEDSLNVFPISNVYTYNDTVFLTKNDPDLLGYPKYEFYCINSFEIQKRKCHIEESQLPVNSWSLFQDSTYDVYANHIGPGGFLVFFYNKWTKKTYATWSDGPRQIFKFNNKYYIAEDGDYKISPAFRKVSDPVQLIEVSNIEAKNLIQHFQHLAPSPGIYYKKLADSIEESKLPSYGNSGRKAHFFISIYTFIKDTSIYSIIKNDSSIYLVTHKNDSLIRIQTVLDTSIEMQRISYSLIQKNHFITFEASGGKMIDNKMQHYSNNGFILIKDSSIDFRYFYFHKPYDP